MRLSVVNLICAITLASLNFNPVGGKNILFYFGSSGLSHRTSAWPLIEKLAEKGHSITLLSPYNSPNANPIPNVTDFVPENLSSDLGLTKIDSVNLRLTQGVPAIDNLWNEYYNAGIRGCESVFSNPKVLQWVEQSSFDLVVINALHNDCAYGLAYKFKAPHILFSTTAPFQWWGDAYGLPDENYPEFQYHYNVNMTFGQSVWNALRPLYWQWKREWEMFPYLENLLRKQLKMENMPSFTEMERNTSLILVNTHFTEEFPRSLPPFVVPIGGIHVKDVNQPLPQDIREFVESGDDGFILLSFGTYATLANFPKKKQDIFLGAMAKVKTKFVVKHDGKTSIKIPKNVKLVKWIPQQDVIAHPKCRGFIGHGGLFGIQEAAYHRVPMILMPLFAEQDYHAVRLHARETGIFLEISELTEGKLLNAITAILTDEKYRNNMKKLSIQFKDRPEKPIDTAVWWVEYVLRHKDHSHLRPIGIHKNWYQKRMLDIWGFLAILFLASFILLTSVLYILVKILANSLFGRDGKRISGKNGKKSN